MIYESANFTAQAISGEIILIVKNFVRVIMASWLLLIPQAELRILIMFFQYFLTKNQLKVKKRLQFQNSTTQFFRRLHNREFMAWYEEN